MWGGLLGGSAKTYPSQGVESPIEFITDCCLATILLKETPALKGSLVLRLPHFDRSTYGTSRSFGGDGAT